MEGVEYNLHNFFYTKVSRINRLTVVYWRIFEHKGEGSRGVFNVCKGFTEIVENLK